jgi:uncharacterized RDD family membrane protein YckC
MNNEQHAMAAAPLASLENRFFGAFIDGVLQTLIFAPILFISGDISEMIKGNINTSMINWDWFAYSVIIFLVLQGYFLVTRGQSIGKMIVGTRIVDEEGKIPSALKIVGLRHLAIMVINQVPYAGGLFSLVDVLFIFRKDRRCIHDMIAQTIVIDTKQEEAWKLAREGGVAQDASETASKGGTGELPENEEQEGGAEG